MVTPFLSEGVRQAARARLARGRAVVERRRSLLRFVTDLQAKGAYIAHWFHRTVCRRLERFFRECLEGKSPRLIIEMPPRHGKTEIVTRAFPVWAMGKAPWFQVMCATYGQDLSDNNSRDAKGYAERAIDLCAWPHLRPKEGEGRVWTSKLWKTANDSQYFATAVDGPAGGFGANMLIIDDYHKNQIEAMSPTIRERVHGWFLSASQTRLEDGGGIIIMSTRWHKDDLIGRVRKAAEEDPEADQWEVMSFPAIAEEGMVLHPDDAANRSFGEALFPQKHPIERLRRIRATMCGTPNGRRWWECVFQQRPGAEVGSTFLREWFHQRYTDHPRVMAMKADSVWLTIDSAESDKESAAFSSLQVWGIVGVKRYLLHRVSVQQRPFELVQTCQDVIASWHPNAVLIEAKSSGVTLVSFLQKIHPRVVAFNPNTFGPKEVRAEHSAGVFAAGNVYLPVPANMPEIGEFIDRHVAFPNGGLPKDDIDAFSQLCIQVDEVYRQRPGADTPSGADRLALWEQVMSAA